MVDAKRANQATQVAPYLTEVTRLHLDEIIPLAIGTTLFGRKPTNDVVLTSAVIGSHIARFVRTGDECWIEDVRARFGISVDGERVQERRLLRDGSEIQLGPYVFRYSDGKTERE